MSKRLHTTLLWLACFGAVTANADRARADDADLERALAEPIVTTASEGAETQSVAPATSVTISAEDIRRYGVQSVDEAINYLALGMMTTNILTRAEVGARGVLLSADYGSHVLVLVNGHHLNEPWNGTAYVDHAIGVPLELVDHIEIILGPGSVLYGSNAMLGVVNVVTKRAKDYSGVHVVAEGMAMPSMNGDAALRAPSASKDYLQDLGTGYRLALGYGKEFTLFGTPAEVTFEGEWWARSGPGFTFGPQAYGADAVTGAPRVFTTMGSSPPPGVWGGVARDSYYQQAPSSHLRLIWGEFELNARANYFRRGVPTETYSDFNNPANHEYERWASLDLRYQHAVTKVLDVGARVYADMYGYEWSALTPAAESCPSGEVNGCTGRAVGVSRWLGSELQAKFDWMADGKLKTLVGVDGRTRYIGSKTDYVDRLTQYTPGSANTYAYSDQILAAYVQQEYLPVAWLAFNAGARADFEHQYHRVSPRAAVSVKPWTGGTAKVVYSEAFRAPSAYERLVSDVTYQIPAPDLNPETVRSVEASFEQRYGSQRWMVGAFRSWWSDMIEQHNLTDAELAAAIAAGQLQPDVTSGVQYRNIGSIDSYGFHVAYDGALLGQRLHYGLNLTGAVSQRHDEQGDATPLPIAPTFFGNARVAYSFGADRPTLGLATQLVGRRPVTDAFNGAFPVTYAEPRVESRLTLSGPVPSVRGLSYRASVNYSFTARDAYVVGPVTAATPDQPAPERMPIERMRLSLGVEYVF